VITPSGRKRDGFRSLMLLAGVDQHGHRKRGRAENSDGRRCPLVGFPRSPPSCTGDTRVLTFKSNNYARCGKGTAIGASAISIASSDRLRAASANCYSTVRARGSTPLQEVQPEAKDQTKTNAMAKLLIVRSFLHSEQATVIVMLGPMATHIV
jgi:hypothetical protein